MKTNNEHIKNEFPTLEKLKKQNGLETPEGYFDSLTNSIMKEVTQPERKRISVYTFLGYAASVAVVIGIASTLFFGNGNQTSENFFDEMTVTEYLEDFSEIDLELDETLTFDEIAMN